MGGYATWKLAGQFPDLFAATPMIVPCPSAGTGWLQGSATVPGGVASETKLLAPSFRNVPQYIWTGSIDPVCAHWAQLDYANVLDSLGYRYQFFSFIGQGHAFVLGNEFQPMVDWMDLRDPDEPWRELSARLARELPGHPILLVESPVDPASYFYLARLHAPRLIEDHLVVSGSRTASRTTCSPARPM